MLRRLIIIAASALLGCGGQVGSTATDAGAPSKDATSNVEAALEVDALSFDIDVPDVLEEGPVISPLDAGPCVPLDGSCITTTQCCSLQNPQGAECIQCRGVCSLASCHQ